MYCGMYCVMYYPLPMHCVMYCVMHCPLPMYCVMYYPHKLFLLQGVTMDRKGVKAALKALLSPEVVLVGHAVHHDLTALRIDHPLVIDTSLIFSYK
jgi:RNA exonuclease 1